MNRHFLFSFCVFFLGMIISLLNVLCEDEKYHSDDEMSFVMLVLLGEPLINEIVTVCLHTIIVFFLFALYV